MAADDQSLATVSGPGRRDSLSELTSAVAMSRCGDKRVTRHLLGKVGLRVPRGRSATCDDGDAQFLAEVGELVVKPVVGEQGDGVSVGVSDPEQLERAIEDAREESPLVLLEELVRGEDVRVLVIDHEVVAAGVRRRPQVEGNGKDSIAALIEAQSRRRADATDGESTIPVDDHTRETVRQAGHTLDDGAARPRLPRAPADGRAVRRPAVPADPGGGLPTVVTAEGRASLTGGCPLVSLGDSV